MPFGFSTFSSFGHDKTHLGWAAGLYGGYRFNSIFSAELSAKYGEMNLSAQDKSGLGSLVPNGFEINILSHVKSRLDWQIYIFFARKAPGTDAPGAEI